MVSCHAHSSNVPVERHVAPLSPPELNYPDSSIPSDDQRRRRRVSAPTQVIYSDSLQPALVEQLLQPWKPIRMRRSEHCLNMDIVLFLRVAEQCSL